MSETQSSVIATEDDWLGIVKATPEQWKIIVMAMSYCLNLSPYDLKGRSEKVLDELDILQPSAGCVPDGFTDELEMSIVRKFRIHYRLAATLAAARLNVADAAEVVVEPSYDDTSTIVIVDGAQRHVLFMTYKKAWNLEYSSVENMIEQIEDDAACIIERWREIL